MPVPKYRTSKSKRDMRRSHHFLRSPALSVCTECNEAISPHTVCSNCGFYRGKLVVSIKSKEKTEDNSTTPAG